MKNNFDRKHPFVAGQLVRHKASKKIWVVTSPGYTYPDQAMWADDDTEHSYFMRANAYEHLPTTKPTPGGRTRKDIPTNKVPNKAEKGKRE